LTVEGCAEIHLGPEGELVVPMRVNGRIVSTQQIWDDGTKKFFPGAPVKGAVHVLCRKESTVTIFCEGVATGMCIFAAVPEASVIVCFSAGNLIEVAKHAKPTGFTVVAADNDEETATRMDGKNPGLAAGQEAATLLKCGLAVPDDTLGSDWLDQQNDWIRRKSDDNTVSRFKKRPELIRQNAKAKLRMAIMRQAVYLPPLLTENTP